MSETTDQTGDRDLPRPQDQEQAEGSPETVDEQLGGTAAADAADPSMGGSSDGDTGG